MMKTAVLLSIAALAVAQSRADAVQSHTGNGYPFEYAPPHALARDELLARAIACDDILCLERELDDKLIHNAVRPFLIVRRTTKRNEEPETQVRSSCCTEFPCYYSQCADTCNYWQRNGGISPCVNGPCGSRSFGAQSEPVSINDGTCYKQGERSEGAEGYQLVPYKPCCDGRVPIEKIGAWGKFCPDEVVDGHGFKDSGDGGGDSGDGGGDSGHTFAPQADSTSAPAYTTAQSTHTTAGRVEDSHGGVGSEDEVYGAGSGGDTDISDSECYGPGMRSIGAEGYSAINYKPCCDGSEAVKRAGDWGMFCPVGSESQETLNYGTGTGKAEAQKGTAEVYAQTVRTRVLHLTQSCARVQETETLTCMQSGLDDILARVAKGESPSEAARSQCCVEDENYRCQCRNTCYFWQNNRFAAPAGLFTPNDSY